MGIWSQMPIQGMIPWRGYAGHCAGRMYAGITLTAYHWIPAEKRSAVQRELRVGNGVTASSRLKKLKALPSEKRLQKRHTGISTVNSNFGAN